MSQQGSISVTLINRDLEFDWQPFKQFIEGLIEDKTKKLAIDYPGEEIFEPNLYIKIVKKEIEYPFSLLKNSFINDHNKSIDITFAIDTDGGDSYWEWLLTDMVLNAEAPFEWSSWWSGGDYFKCSSRVFDKRWNDLSIEERKVNLLTTSLKINRGDFFEPRLEESVEFVGLDKFDLFDYINNYEVIVEPMVDEITKSRKKLRAWRTKLKADAEASKFSPDYEPPKPPAEEEVRQEKELAANKLEKVRQALAERAAARVEAEKVT